MPALTRTRAAAATLVVAVLASACSGGSGADEPSAGGSSSPTASPSPTTYLPVPETVTLTEPGTALGMNGEATVAWAPAGTATPAPEDQVGVATVKVTKLESTSIKASFGAWVLDDADRGSNPYYVRATVTNTGTTDLGGRPVPLYAVDAAGNLVEATTFAKDFKACPSVPLATPFPAGTSTKVCLVYLLPDKGQLTGVSFRPTPEFTPITWTGKVKPLGRKKKQSG